MPKIVPKRRQRQCRPKALEKAQRSQPWLRDISLWGPKVLGCVYFFSSEFLFRVSLGFPSQVPKTSLKCALQNTSLAATGTAPSSWIWRTRRTPETLRKTQQNIAKPSKWTIATVPSHESSGYITRTSGPSDHLTLVIRWMRSRSLRKRPSCGCRWDFPIFLQCPAERSSDSMWKTTGTDGAC